MLVTIWNYLPGIRAMANRVHEYSDGDVWGLIESGAKSVCVDE